eukprot:9487598-Pyramimonas_sp.AAC.1
MRAPAPLPDRHQMPTSVKSKTGKKQKTTAPAGAAPLEDEQGEEEVGDEKDDDFELDLMRALCETVLGTGLDEGSASHDDV